MAAEIITYEGRVWDVDAQTWETFDRPARCEVIETARGIPGVRDHLRVRLADWPKEPHVYLIFDLEETT